MGNKKGSKRGPYKTAFVKLKSSEGDEWVKLALTHLASSDIFDERMKQWKKWSYEHDDKHSAEDWVNIIRDHFEDLDANTDSKKLTKKFLVRIGAVVLAALEADMRKMKHAKR